jgi:DNA-directed RNA polymerase specialized sigma24 family protein
MAIQAESTIDQRQFIEMMRCRDVRALEVLYDQYSAVLYGVIFRITGDEKKSEEILYRTFTHIWNTFQTFDDSVHTLCLWMVNIARGFSFETLTPDERTMMKQQLLLSLGNRWMKDQVEVLSYAFFNGMSVEKMARKFGYTESKIKSLLHEAVDHLKKEYVAK